jgi:regulatory protein
MAFMGATVALEWRLARRSSRPPPPPFDEAALRALTAAYAARYQTTRARLAAYLGRKLRERGWAGDGDPPVDAMVQRQVDMGAVDDAAWAQARAGLLERRGLGARRVVEGLARGGISREVRAELAAQADPEAQALAYAQRRRLGRFRPAGPGAPDQRRRDMAAMLRAGHGWEAARAALENGEDHDAADSPDHWPEA